VNEIAEAIGVALGKPVQREYLPARIGDVQDSWADVDEARRLLGYETSVGLADGLERTVKALLACEPAAS
jgi:UDP-glucose 4-epimerase